MFGPGTAANSVVAPPGVREESARASIVSAHMSRFCSITPGILLDISGRARPVKEMTTSSTAILLTKRYPNPSDCKSGTKRCWTSLCQSASSMITRCVKCMLGGDWPILSWFLPCPYALCLILGVYCISFKWIEHQKFRVKTYSLQNM